MTHILTSLLESQQPESCSQGLKQDTLDIGTPVGYVK